MLNTTHNNTASKEQHGSLSQEAKSKENKAHASNSRKASWVVRAQQLIVRQLQLMMFPSFAAEELSSQAVGLQASTAMTKHSYQGQQRQTEPLNRKEGKHQEKRLGE